MIIIYPLQVSFELPPQSKGTLSLKAPAILFRNSESRTRFTGGELNPNDLREP